MKQLSYEHSLMRNICTPPVIHTAPSLMVAHVCWIPCPLKCGCHAGQRMDHDRSDVPEWAYRTWPKYNLFQLTLRRG